jgi:hypothetical protein
MADNNDQAIEYGRFSVIYETEDGEFHVLPYMKMTIMRHPSGERYFLDEEHTELQRRFRMYLVEIGALGPEDDIGRPLIAQNHIEYFKIDSRSKNQ